MQNFSECVAIPFFMTLNSVGQLGRFEEVEATKMINAGHADAGELFLNGRF